MKNKKNVEKKMVAISGDNDEKLKKYANAPYIKEKDKRAKEFLQKHPIPAKFLK